MSSSKSAVVAAMQGPLCGTLATMFLYGIICMQAFYYAQTYEKDRKFIKIFVVGIWLFETAHTALSIQFLEYYLILHFGDMETLKYEEWTVGATYIVGFFIAYSVNICFIWRIWILSRRLWIAIVLTVLATARLGFGLANCSLGFRYPMWTSLREHVFPTTVTGRVPSVVVDSSIACALCYYLHKHRTGIKRTDTIINRLLLYAINTGAVTSFVAVIVIIMFLALPHALAFIGFVQVQSKLYAVSLFASLNSRNATKLSARMALSTIDNVSLTFTSEKSDKIAQILPSQNRIRRVEIQQTKEVYSLPDRTSKHSCDHITSSDSHA